jgi:hypothetical protein
MDGEAGREGDGAGAIEPLDDCPPLGRTDGVALGREAGVALGREAPEEGRDALGDGDGREDPPEGRGAALEPREPWLGVPEEPLDPRCAFAAVSGRRSSTHAIARAESLVMVNLRRVRTRGNPKSRATL